MNSAACLYFVVLLTRTPDAPRVGASNIRHGQTRVVWKGGEEMTEATTHHTHAIPHLHMYPSFQTAVHTCLHWQLLEVVETEADGQDDCEPWLME
jgi:hypothetical protein